MNSDADTSPTPKRRRRLVAGVLAAAAVALAIPVSGAFAGPGDSGDRGDCPEHKGGDRSGTSVDPTREL